jgi:signal transduction histidine kinase/ActR/RegA family two-component response regulator
VSERLLQHARQLFRHVSLVEVLVQTCREALRLPYAARAFGTFVVPGHRWERGLHILQDDDTHDVPPPALSALFAIHRRLAGTRAPLLLEHSLDSEAVFSGLCAQGAGVIYAVPIVHRTGRLFGEITLLADAAHPDTTGALAELASLASAALESMQRFEVSKRDQERLQFLAEATEEALWDWNLDTGEFWWGGGIQNLVGAARESIQNHWDWKRHRIHPDDLERVSGSLRDALSSAESAWRSEYRFRHGAGAWVDVEDSGYFLREPNGRAYRMIGAMRDVTVRKQLLERETQARAEAESANRAKDQFLAMLGHELRNPLAPILTALQLIRLRGTESAERELTVIERQADHLARLVDDLLDVSRIARGAVELKKKRVELAELVAKAIEMASPLIEQRQHDLVVRVSPRGLTIDADPARMAQVISNLLTNAAKYTECGGRIYVGATRGANHVELKVRDTGIGIPRETLPSIFEMFVQERQSLDRSHGGLGLGLSIVRNLVALHGGTVSAHSEGRGSGSEFTITMPAVGDPLVAEDAPAADAVPHEIGHRILVVDDNEDVASLMAECLQILGNTTRVAHDGPAALRIAEEFSPDFALLDIGLPIMDGYELARRLREQTTHRLRLIAVTGYGQDADKQRAADASFDAHLVKPVSVSRLQHAIRDLACEQCQPR